MQKIKFLESTMLLLILLFVSSTTSTIKTFKNLNANETTYFSFTKGDVTNDKEAWDILFERTNLGIKNAAIILDKKFDELTVAPKEGYVVETKDKKSIPSGSGNGWYKYSMSDHSINPLPGKTLVVKTSDNKFVKVEILSYYKDLNGDSGYYTFRYEFIAQ